MYRKILIATTLLLSVGAKAQTSKVSFAAVAEHGVKYYAPRFTPVSIHMGVWVNKVGILGGYVEYSPTGVTKDSESGKDTLIWRKVLSATLAARFTTKNDRWFVSPFITAGTHNYIDMGVRAGVRYNDLVSFHALATRKIWLGFGLTVAISNSLKTKTTGTWPTKSS